MKRIFSVILILVIVLLSVLSVNATKTDPDTIFTLEELGITIHVPLHKVATRTQANFDIEPEKFDELVEKLEKDNLHLWGYSEFYYEELYVSGLDVNTKSLLSYSEEKLNEMKDIIKKDYESNGCVVTKSEIYEGYDTKYILTHLSKGKEYYAISYYTIENYKSIEISIVCYGAEPTASQRKDLLSIINSIEYHHKDSGSTIEPIDITDYLNGFENTFVFRITKDGKLTPLGKALIISGLTTFIFILMSGIAAIIVVKKIKKHRKTAQTQNTKSTKFCIYCGTLLSATDSFCHKCGKSQ